MEKYTFHTKNNSLSDQLRDAIVEMLLTEKFDGNKLPAESKIAARFGVSISSVRDALLLLREEGVITKKHGSGNFFHLSALDYSKRLEQFSGFRTYLEANGYEVTEKNDGLQEMTVPDYICGRLNLRHDDKIIYYNRTIYADGHPAIHCSNHLPSKLFKEIPEQLPSPLNIFDIFWKYLGKEFTHGLMEFIPYIATELETGQIGVSPGVPLVIMREIYYSIEDEPLAFSYNKFNHEFVTISTFSKA